MRIATIALLLICTAAFAQQKGSFTDPRDKKKYKTVKIGERTWMAENLNYNAKDSKCYDDKPANCAKYGRLYMSDTTQKICPKGWELPSSQDWYKLAEYLGSEPALKLKAKSSWDNRCYAETGNCNGKDDVGFAALAGGYKEEFKSEDKTIEKYETILDHGYWWTVESAARMASYYNDIRFGYYSSRESYAFSIRCLKELTAAEKKAIEKARADALAKAQADSVAREKAKADSVAKAKAQADSVAKAKAAAREAAKPMYCVTYIEGKVRNCEATKDTEDDRWNCERKSRTLASMRGQARFVASNPCEAPAAAPANAPAQAPAAAGNPSKPMYCVSSVMNNPVSCLELTDTPADKSICDKQSSSMKMMMGKADWTAAKPTVKCDKVPKK